ncbi:MAG: hypothetical protein ACXAEU_25285 [Candidatus Hodarchaeales archaeon]|jgi:hypothetical protein
MELKNWIRNRLDWYGKHNILLLTGAIFAGIIFGYLLTLITHYETSAEKTGQQLVIITSIVGAAIPYTLLFAQWEYEKDKKKKEEEEKKKTRIIRVLETILREIEANKMLFQSKPGTNVKFKLFENVFQMIVENGDVNSLDDYNRGEILLLRAEISIYNQTYENPSTTIIEKIEKRMSDLTLSIKKTLKTFS